MMKIPNNSGIYSFASLRLGTALGGKLVVPNAFDSKETPSQDRGSCPDTTTKGLRLASGAIGIVLAAIGAVGLRWETSQPLTGITAVRRGLGLTRQ